MTLKIRASSAPLAQHCAGSVALAHIAPGESDELGADMASLGIIAHAELAKMVRGEPWEAGETDAKDAIINGAALWRRGSPDDGLAPLAHYFDQHRDDPPRLYVEHTLQCDEHGGGTQDVGCWRERDETIVVLDWKTGYKTEDHTYQLARYGELFGAELGVVPKRMILITVFPRLWNWHVATPTVDEAREWTRLRAENAVLAEEWLAGDRRDLNVFRTGSHCARCYHAEVCPARTAMVRRMAGATVPDVSALDLSRLDDAGLANAYHVVNWLEKAAKQAREELKALVLARGSVPVGESKALVVKVTGKTELVPRLTIPVLRRIKTEGGEPIFTDEALAGCLKVSWPEVQAVVKAQAPRGKKTEAVDALADTLEAAGALVKVSGGTRMELVNVEKLLEGAKDGSGREE